MLCEIVRESRRRRETPRDSLVHGHDVPRLSDIQEAPVGLVLDENLARMGQTVYPDLDDQRIERPDPFRLG